MELDGEITTTHLLVFLIILLILYLIWPNSTLKKLGIPGPRPLPLLGNFLDFRKGILFADRDWIKTYGKIMGYYEGATPTLLIADVNFIKEIGVTQFSHFMNRRTLTLKNRPIDKSLNILRDDRWKYVRSLITSTFFQGKLKKVSPHIVRASENLLKSMKEYCDQNKPANVKKMYGTYIVESIGAAAFGLDIDSKKDETFLNHAKELLEFNFLSLFSLGLFMIPSVFNPIMNKLDIGFTPRKTKKYFIDIVNQAIGPREEDDQKQVDFLQFLINAHKNQDQDNNLENDDTLVESEKDKALIDSENYAKEIASKNVTGLKNGLESDELYAQSLAFFMGGYETTSTLLSFLSYVLATHPEVQEKLIEEVDEVTAGNLNVVYETVANMPYLDMVVCETFRMYPPATRTDRECTKDCTVNGVFIPKGMLVTISIWAVHYDENLWPEPEKFIPERFSKEKREKRNPYAWIPFGIGPRNCVGMRFALIAAKIGIVKVLQNFTFEVCAETEIPPNLGKSNFFLKPPNGINLKLKSRV